MAQFDYYATWNDDWGLLECLLHVTHAVLVPNKWYEQDQVDVYEHLTDELKSILHRRGQLMVFPPFARIDAKAGLYKHTDGPFPGWYTVRPDSFGENLQWSLSGEFIMDGTTSLSNGILSCMSEYWNHENDAWQKPSHELVQFYRHVRALFRKQMTKVDVDGVGLWMGSEAKSLYQSGQAQVMLYGKWRRVTANG